MRTKKPIPWGTVWLFFLLLTCDTAAQLLFKKSVLGLGEFPTQNLSAAFTYLLQLAANPLVIAGVITLILAFFIWLAIISHIDLSKAHTITCLVFGTVAVSSSIVFHEAFSNLQYLGVFLIMLGAYIASEHL
jgi:drug/metabolite transporter (DMT)-like permease